MQTNFFASLATQAHDQATVDAVERASGPVELDLATLEHVGGGVTAPAGPAGTW